MTKISGIQCGLPTEYSHNSINAKHFQVKHFTFTKYPLSDHFDDLKFVCNVNAAEFRFYSPVIHLRTY